MGVAWKATDFFVPLLVNPSQSQRQDLVQPNVVSLSATVGTVPWPGALHLLKGCQDWDLKTPVKTAGLLTNLGCSVGQSSGWATVPFLVGGFHFLSLGDGMMSLTFSTTRSPAPQASICVAGGPT